jgi:hypothetical protein
LNAAAPIVCDSRRMNGKREIRRAEKPATIRVPRVSSYTQK